MYCRTLKYRDPYGRFDLLVEEQPDGSLQLWEFDVPGDPARRQYIIDKIADGLVKQGKQLRVVWGQKRVQRASASGLPW
ncbi:MAG: hypothetical protein KF871_03675 [Hydrogenophaga sp.]|uniref:hypothetical protein n=1 Tax=Hydrogenophaga sp. TaxID=1904254 RepID=UPI001DCE7C0B|nr:hypothetical protein [Hydrogenophaga sp.]MBX3608972.1 hypothetical protein [Hydrogenophaga sp.]